MQFKVGYKVRFVGDELEGVISRIAKDDSRPYELTLEDGYLYCKESELELSLPRREWKREVE